MEPILIRKKNNIAERDKMLPSQNQGYISNNAEIQLGL